MTHEEREALRGLYKQFKSVPLDNIKMKARAEAAEARVEALERAIREFAPCKTCAGAHDCKIYGQALVCTLFGFKPDAWQFDQARFEKGGERDG